MLVRRRDNMESPLLQLRDEMDRLVQSFLQDMPAFGPPAFSGWRAFPPVNIWQDDENLYLEAELPGLSSSEVNVSVVGNECTIKGERPIGEAKEERYLRRERQRGSFHRVIRLPVDVDADAVEADLNDGVLQVRLPKAASARVRRIEVKALSD